MLNVLRISVDKFSESVHIPHLRVEIAQIDKGIRERPLDGQQVRNSDGLEHGVDPSLDEHRDAEYHGQNADRNEGDPHLEPGIEVLLQNKDVEVLLLSVQNLVFELESELAELDEAPSLHMVLDHVGVLRPLLALLLLELFQ